MADKKTSPLGFVWTAIQSLLIMKTVVLFLGIRYAEDPTPINRWMLVGAIVTSFSTLFFFAWKKGKENPDP